MASNDPDDLHLVTDTFFFPFYMIYGECLVLTTEDVKMHKFSVSEDFITF